MIDVRAVEDRDEAAWERFLADRSVAHHAYAWSWKKVLPEVFGHRAYYLIAEERSDAGAVKVVGILPMFLLKSILFGRALISVPYLNAGGILADTAEIADLLRERAERVGRELDVDYIELRHREQFAPLEGRDGIACRSHKVSMVLPLPGTAEDLFDAFPPKLRSQIRRPSKSGVVAQLGGVDCSESAALKAFYTVFSEHMRDLGTPVYPRALFDSVREHFKDRHRTVTVWHEGKPVAAGITLRQGAGVEIPWASALKRVSKLSPNMLLYWAAIKTAIGDGATSFDFGRSSPDTGTYRFKEQWGPEPVPLHWYYTSVKKEIPDVNPKSPKYAAIVECWKRLPLGVANTVGPYLTRSLP